MSGLRKEWTDEETMKLGCDMNEAKIKVLANHGFSVSEISRTLGFPEFVIRSIIDKKN